MHQPPKTPSRVRRMVDEVVRPAILGRRVPFEVLSTPEVFTPIPYSLAQAEPLEPLPVGSPWGRAWHSRWLCLRASMPEGWARPLAHIDLGFLPGATGFHAEALAWRDGRILHAIQPDRRLVHLGDVTPGAEIELWVEAAANPLVGARGYRPTPVGDPATASEAPLYSVVAAELAEHRPVVASLALELEWVLSLAESLPESSPMRSPAFASLEASLAAIRLTDVEGSAQAARSELAAVLGRPAAAATHRIVATGHAHLDTAWLWPIRETRRKAVRTFANAIDLLDRNPDHHVTVSQALHYQWVADDAPELFERVKQLVAAGRWEPAGGMWVEPDLLMPSGESLVRQFLHGQHAFIDWFGVSCPGVFVPDDFGYPGTIPQLARGAGCDWFFTQKLSWNDTNDMPHSTFWWEGIDGSRVLAHLSPIENYNATMSPGELLHAVDTFAEHALSRSSFVCFGHGNGGGGATAEMIQRARLAADVEGLPRVEFGSAADFFAEEMASADGRLPTWVGEMYFEMHRGVTTSQLKTKQGNRRAEQLLHELELWSVATGTALARSDELWRRTLTQQFHDILPGSSIAWVHQDAEIELASVATEIEKQLVEIVGGRGGGALLNPAPVPVEGVVEVDGEVQWVSLPALGGGGVGMNELPDSVEPVRIDGRAFDNGVIRLQWDARGHVVSLVHLATGREVVPEGRPANQLRLLRDRPAEYDAWDIDRADTADGEGIVETDSVDVIQVSPLQATLRVTHRFGASTATQLLTMGAGSARLDGTVSVDWQESERRLQLVWPLDVHTSEATCGIQFGHLRRARHMNTSWDAAQFEICAHRYVHVAEHGFGVALMADAPHGYDIRGDALRMSLLKASGFPDPNADRGRQRITYAVWVHSGDAFEAGLEEEAHRVNHPIRRAEQPLASPVELDAPGALLSSVKVAHDGSQDLIVRIWETRGGRADGLLRVRGKVTACHRCDLLERQAPQAMEARAVPDGVEIEVALRPFEVQTFRFRRNTR